MVGPRSRFGRGAPPLPVRLVLLVLLSALAPAPTQAATFTVTTTADAGAGSLRAAITSANGTPALDTIDFNIAPGGPQTISLASFLPSITRPVIVDGTTQPGFAGTPIIELNASFGGATAALRLDAGSSGSTIRGLVINRSPGYGVRIFGSSNNVVAGNFLGTNAAGTGALANSTGVFIQTGTGNRIGGTVAADRNVISGNNVDGIQISGDGADGNFVEGNYIGVDVNGTADLGNGGQGVVIYLGADNNTIGGTAAGAGNVISGNNNGIAINDAGTTGNLVQGNFIGSDWTGTLGVGNTLRGITCDGGSTNNTVGGTVAGAGNTIAFNGSEGVWLGPTVSGVAIQGNSIFSNAGMGIDLNGNGFPEINDAGDGDSGANTLQNQPVLSAAMTNGVSATFAGSLDSVASTTFRIEFFANTAIEPTGYGEGKRYLGSTNVTTNASGTVLFGVTLTPAVPLAVGEWVAATATRTVAPLHTSEFGNAFLAVGDLVVTTTADGAPDGNTSSVSALIGNPGGGLISLREAITATNNTAGAQTIRFGLPLHDPNHLYYRENGAPGLAEVSTTLADVFTPSSTSITDFDADYPTGLARSWYRIRPTSALPSITGAVVIDASWHPLSNTVGPLIELDGTSAGAVVNGLVLAAGSAGSTIRGLVINRFSVSGILVSGSNGNTVDRSYLGTNAAGTADLGNTQHGIQLYNGASNNVIGGALGTSGNVISGNDVNGVDMVNATTSGNRVIGNIVGLDVTGTADIGNVMVGVAMGQGANANIVGESGTGRNVISGNNQHGVRLVDGNTSSNRVQNNYIGLDINGTADLGNNWDGVRLETSPVAATGNVVGGTSAGLGNVISGNNLAGIHLRDYMTGTVIAGNIIGRDATNTAPVPNSAAGITIVSASNNTIGGTGANDGNTIANNGADGIVVSTGSQTPVGNALLGNAIFSNAGLGIDLSNDGVTANDPLDADTGPNGLLNFPQVVSVSPSAGTVTAWFRLDAPAGSYRIEFFKSPSGADGSGYGEGETFASSANVTHPGTGPVYFNHTFAGNAGDVITATTIACTDGAACAAFGSTSEFSNAVTAFTTAVELMSFAATAGDQAVDLSWQTGSELNNLGFHLHRGLSESGPWTRLTPSLIPGLGSSPLGASYSWHDGDLVNGTRYYYRLEDVDTASVSTFHGPVSAVPSPPGEDGGDDGGGDGTESGGSSSCPSWILAASPDAVSPRCTRHGDPDSVSLQILARDSSSATLELHTGGFWALREVAGEVRVFVPGLELPLDPSAPALPLRRALVAAVVGKRVELVSAEAFDLRSFRGLRPSAVGLAEMAVGRDGTVRPARRALSAPVPSRGYLPGEVARLAGTVFQGERKSAVVEITPVRFSGSGPELVLAGRVRVKLAFTGIEEGESGAASRGRSMPRRGATSREVLAQLHTSRRGLHAVSFERLFPQRGRGFSTAFLRLQRQGEAVAFHVEPSGVFGPGSVLYFFADRTALSTDYTSEVAYELVRSPGVQMTAASALPVGAPVAAPSVGFASFETNRLYQPGLLEAPDVWVWEAMGSGVTRTKSFTLWGVETSSAGLTRLVVHLQGGSASGVAVDHHVQVSLNGVEVGEARFTGKRAHRVEVAAPVSALREGANELSLTNAGDTGVVSLVFLDRFEVSYPQVSAVRGGVFEGVWGDGGTVAVGGLTGVPVILRDSGPADGSGVSTVRWVTGFEATPGSVRFHVEAGERYAVVSPDGLLSPRIGRMALSTLRDAGNQADYLVIAPRELLEAAQPLVERRRSEGLASRGVAFEEIAAEFGHGQPSGEAIREFLKYAYHSWARPSPRYVLLLGDATCDPRRFLSTSWASPLPALWARTSYLWTVSDPALAAVNGEDLLPDLSIGRLPATTLEEAEKLVSKLLAWEDSGQGLSGNVVLVADNPDQGGDFEVDVEDIRMSFLFGRNTTTLKVGELGGASRPAILGAFDEGVSLMSYVGHGGTAVWAGENVLSSWDVPALRAQSQQPLLLTLNCLNGYFVAPNLDALPEALLKAEGRGVVGAFSPSGLSLDGPAHQYHRAVMAELANGPHERLGDAILAAQRTYAETGLMPELLGVYHLLGDPATRLR